MTDAPVPGTPNEPLPSVSVVIPSLTGEVRRVLQSLESQSIRPVEIHVVTGLRPAGHARNVGVAATTGELILFIDDDAYLGQADVLEQLVSTLTADPQVGVVGPSKVIPRTATWLQRQIASQTPRWEFPVLDADQDSNPPLRGYGFSGITTTCCLISRSVFEQVGGFDPSFLTGEDTELFYRLRAAGYRFVIPRRCRVYHDPPRTLRTLLRKSFQYGIGYAQETKKAPQREMAVVRLDRWWGWLLVIGSPLLFPLSLFLNVYPDQARPLRFGFLPVKALSTYATLYGYAWEWLQPLRTSPRLDREGTGEPAAREDPPGEAARGSLTLLGAFTVIAFLNYAFAIAMSHLLSVEDFGTFGVVQSILLVGATAVGAGFPWAVAHRLADYPDDSKAVIRAGLLGNLLLGTLIGGLFAVLGLSGWLSFGERLGWVLPVAGATIVVLAVGEVLAGTLQGLVRLTALGLVRALEVLVKVLAGLMLVLLGMGALGAVLGIFVGACVASAMAAVMLRDVRVSSADGPADPAVFRAVVSYFVVMFGLSVIMNADIVGLELLSPPGRAGEFTGHYQVAVTLARIPIFLTLTLLTAVFPHLVRHRMSPTGNTYAHMALKYSVLFIAPLNVVLIVIPIELVRILFSPTFAASAAPLAVAALGTGILSLGYACAILLIAAERGKFVASVLPAVAGVEFAALAVAVPTFGPIGAALALIVAAIALVLLLVPSVVREFRVALSRQTVVAYLLAVFAFGVLLRIASPEGAAATVGVLLAATGAYVMLLCLLGLIRPSDVSTLGSGLGSRAARLTRVAASVVGRLNLAGTARE